MQETKKIYIVEDDSDDFMFIDEALRDVAPCLDAVRFSDAEELFNYLQLNNNEPAPSLFIIDFNLPRSSGAAIIKKLQGHSAFTDVPKVVYSNSTFPAHQTEAVACGAAAYFSKSTDMASIKQDVLEMLFYARPAVL